MSMKTASLGGHELAPETPPRRGVRAGPARQHPTQRARCRKGRRRSPGPPRCRHRAREADQQLGGVAAARPDGTPSHRSSPRVRVTHRRTVGAEQADASCGASSCGGRRLTPLRQVVGAAYRPLGNAVSGARRAAHLWQRPDAMAASIPRQQVDRRGERSSSSAMAGCRP